MVVIRTDEKVDDGSLSKRVFCHCAIDIGGTLAKVVYLQEDTISVDGTSDEAFCDHTENTVHEYPLLVGSSDMKLPAHTFKNCYPEDTNHHCQVLKFRYFPTSDIENMVLWLKEENIVCPGIVLPVTGGGAFKFEEMLRDRLGVEISRLDEMSSAMTGLSFLMSKPDEVFCYDLQTETMTTVSAKPPFYPFLLVNIGSGVSILKAESATEFKRITGTCVGGGTVLGLARCLLGVKTFDDVIALSKKGTNRLDLVVADLYGDAAGSRCLPGDTLASRREDIARSLIHMVSYNLGYLAYLIGTIHHITRVFFAGKFINNHHVTMQAITHSVHFYASHYRHHLSDRGETLQDLSVGYVPPTTTAQFIAPSPENLAVCNEISSCLTAAHQSSAHTTVSPTTPQELYHYRRNIPFPPSPESSASSSSSCLEPGAVSGCAPNMLELPRSGAAVFGRCFVERFNPLTGTSEDRQRDAVRLLTGRNSIVVPNHDLSPASCLHSGAFQDQPKPVADIKQADFEVVMIYQ